MNETGSAQSAETPMEQTPDSLNDSTDRKSALPEPESERKPLAGRGFFRKHFIEPFVSSKNPPWFDARGVAVGLAIGFGAPIGTHMVLLGLLRALFRFNSVAAFAFTWVNNPISILPLYYGYYYVGSIILGKSPAISPHDFQELLDPILHSKYFWQGFHAFVHLGWDVVGSWSVSAAILGSTTATLGYVVSLRAQKARNRRRAREMGISYEQLFDKLESRRAEGTESD